MTRLPGHLSGSRGATLALQARIALARLGSVRLLAGLSLLVGLSAWLWALPAWQQRLDAQQATTAAQRQAARAAAAAANESPAAATNLAQFHALLLADEGAAEGQLKPLFALARKHGLGIEQAEYRLAAEPHGQFRTYQIRLPLKGRYASVRGFAEDVLRAMPFASLDAMSFKRDDVRDDLPQAQLRFTFHLAAPHSGGGA